MEPTTCCVTHELIGTGCCVGGTKLADLEADPSALAGLFQSEAPGKVRVPSLAVAGRTHGVSCRMRWGLAGVDEHSWLPKNI